VKARGNKDLLQVRVVPVPPARVCRAQQPRSARLYFVRGNQRYQRGNLDQAISDFGTALAFDPSFTQAYNNRAVTLQQKGELEPAVEDYTRAIELDSFFNRGLAHLVQNDHEAARSGFGACPDSRPRNQGRYGQARQ
jgi:tetratricopeptide (TPR) repeat protein